jgi:hypothetical protein
VTKQSEPDSDKATLERALVEKDQLVKEKKSRTASDKNNKKSKKPSKSHAKSEPQGEDAFLPPLPLPSKPAAIGGSGG